MYDEDIVDLHTLPYPNGYDEWTLEGLDYVFQGAFWPSPQDNDLWRRKFITDIVAVLDATGDYPLGSTYSSQN